MCLARRSVRSSHHWAGLAPWSGRRDCVALHRTVMSRWLWTDALYPSSSLDGSRLPLLRSSPCPPARVRTALLRGPRPVDTPGLRPLGWGDPRRLSVRYRVGRGGRRTRRGFEVLLAWAQRPLGTHEVGYLES